MCLTADIIITSAALDKNWLNTIFVVFLFLHICDCRWTEFINCDILIITGCYNNTKLVFGLQEMEFIIRNTDGLSLRHSVCVMYSYLQYLHGDLDCQ